MNSEIPANPTKKIPHFISGNYLETVNQLCHDKVSPQKTLVSDNSHADFVRSKMREIIENKYQNSEEIITFLLRIIIRVVKYIFECGNIHKKDIISFPINLTREMIEEYPIETFYQLKNLQQSIKDQTITVTNICIIRATDKSRINREIRKLLTDNVKRKVIHVPGSPVLVCIFKGDLFFKCQFISYENYGKFLINNREFSRINSKNIANAIN